MAKAGKSGEAMPWRIDESLESACSRNVGKRHKYGIVHQAQEGSNHEYSEAVI